MAFPFSKLQRKDLENIRFLQPAINRIVCVLMQAAASCASDCNIQLLEYTYESGYELYQQKVQWQAKCHTGIFG